MKKLLGIAALFTLSACSEKAPEPDPIIKEGMAIYTANCKACHAQGINGAPILGNSKMWAKRQGQGIDVLTQHASEGFGLMPAKGGNTELSSEQIKAAITYMLSELDSTP